MKWIPMIILDKPTLIIWSPSQSLSLLLMPNWIMIHPLVMGINNLQPVVLWRFWTMNEQLDSVVNATPDPVVRPQRNRQPPHRLIEKISKLNRLITLCAHTQHDCTLIYSSNFVLLLGHFCNFFRGEECCIYTDMWIYTHAHECQCSWIRMFHVV